MMKRITAALLAAALFLTLTGCADASERQSRKTALRILRGDNLGYHLSTGTAVENQEVYNDGTIVIQLGGISGTPDDPQLVLAVKNGSRKEITFTAQRCFINGWQTDCWSDVYEIAGHSTITATVSISSDLELARISDIRDIQLDFDLYDKDYNSIGTGSASFQTNAESAEDSYTPSGTVLLDDGDYKVVAWLVRSGYDNSTRVCTYAENNTNRAVNVTNSKARLNGEPVEYWFFQDINAGARRISSDSLYDSDSYESIELTDSDTLTYTLQISDSDSNVQLLTQEVTLTLADLQ